MPLVASVAWLGSYVILLTGLAMLGVIWLAWRGGDRAAGILLLAFAIPVSLACLRLLFSLGLFRWAPELILLGPWAMVLSTPVVLLGLVDRTRQLQGELLRVQAEVVLSATPVKVDVSPSYPVPGAVSPARGSPPPAELARLVELGQVKVITEWALALKDKNPHLADFADRVLIAVRELDFDPLQELSQVGAHSPAVGPGPERDGESIHLRAVKGG